LPQQPDFENHTVLEQVFADSGEQMALVREYEELSDKLAHAQDDSSQLMSRLTAVMQRMEVSGAWELETNAKIILTKLGIQDFTPVSVVYPAATASVLLGSCPTRSRMCC